MPEWDRGRDRPVPGATSRAPGGARHAAPDRCRIGPPSHLAAGGRPLLNGRQPMRVGLYPLAGGADHHLDSAVALAAQLVGIIALGPFRTEPAGLDPVR